MPSIRRSGHPYRICGADRVTGQDVEIVVEAYDEADAARAANRQGVLVAACAAVSDEGTFCRAIADDPVARRLLERFPQLGYRMRRLNDEDQAYLSNLAGDLEGVSYRDSADLARVIRDNSHLPRSG